MVAGFVTVCMDALPLSRRERGPDIRYKYISSLKLARLHNSVSTGGSREWESGAKPCDSRWDWLNASVNRWAADTLRSTPNPDLERWYESLGFLRNKTRQEERIEEAQLHQRNPDSIAVSMRFDLRAPA